MTASAGLEKPRYFFGLDTLRASLMLIGVFWHTVSVLSPLGNFVYASELHRSPILYALIYPEHIFRMEAFFLVSGFLSRMVLTRRDKRHFLSARLKRVLLPLLLGCFALNLMLQMAGAVWLPRFEWRHFDLWRLVMHGWFLITLFLCALIDLALPRDVCSRTGLSGMLLIVVVAVFGYVLLSFWKFDILAALGLIGPAPASGLRSLNMVISMPENLFNFLILNTVQYWPFYFAGSLLYANRSWLDKLSIKWLYWALAVGLAAGTAEYLHSNNLLKIFHGPYQLGALWYRANHLLAAGGIAFALFLIFYRSQHQDSKTVRYMIDSAIVIYLVHHPLVMLFAKLYDSPAIGNISYYALLLVSVLALSYAAYEWIRRHAALCIAFGLKVK